MFGIVTISTPILFPTRNGICFPVRRTPNQEIKFQSHKSSLSKNKIQFPFSLEASSLITSDYREEKATNVKFQTSLSLPGCSNSLSLLGTGYREKVFAIIGVKVYAAGFYVHESIFSNLPAADIQDDVSLFNSIFQDPLEKSLQIVLVRDVDGKTFWDALDEAISPRITNLIPEDESALSTFRGIFQGRSLKKGTFIFLTWLEKSKIYTCPRMDCRLPWMLQYSR